MEEIKLPTRSNVFQLLTRIQDEVHRFVIGFHHQSAQKRTLTSILDEIPGVGPKRKRLLIQNFGSLEKMLEADDSVRDAWKSFELFHADKFTYPAASVRFQSVD